MFEFTEAYLKPFSWARQAYEYTLGLSGPGNVTITADSLTAPSLPSLPTDPIHIFTDADWNYTSRSQVALVGALYQTTDQAEQYFNTIYTLVTSRMAESEKRVQELDSTLRVLLSSSKQVATTSINIKGGDTTSLEAGDKYYRVFGPLASVSDENVFRLKDTGYFSSIRSLGGFAGQAIIEYSLGNIVQNGSLASISDGTRNTFWMGTFYAPAPVRADQNDVPWLPDEYKHGFAFMLTYYMDRPTLATEVFLDPVTTEPMDLVSISWTPSNVGNSIINGSFSNAASGWTIHNHAGQASSIGIGNSTGVYAYNTSGWVSQIFALPGNYLTEIGSSLVSTGRRAQIHYSMRGVGDLYAGARIIWYDNTGKVLSYKVREDYPTGFYMSQRFVDSIPEGAVSGRLDLGIFTPATTSASAFFDEVILYLGERIFQCAESIDKPKTISLPEIVRSGRFSFVFAQRNPRREVLSKEAASVTFTPIQGLPDLDASLQEATVAIGEQLENQGPGNTLFAYRIGMKELDLRYREHIPRGSIVSLPLVSKKEIRELWITSELGQFYNDNTKFYIYPFPNDPSQKLEIAPFRMGDIDNAQGTTITEGEILRIYTFEEQESGWYNAADRSFITAPRDITERFDGTDRDGKIVLSQSPHLRRPLMANIGQWLDTNAIWPTQFDPNLQTIYGLPSTYNSLRDAIRQSDPNATLDMNYLISRTGYTPVKVTVKTDKWIAQPDIYGKPDTSKIRVARGEVLAATTYTQTIVEQSQSTVAYEAWLNSTLSGAFIRNGKTIGFGLAGDVVAALRKPDNANKTLKQAIDQLLGTGTGPNTIKRRDQITQQMTAIYNKLKAQGQVGNDSNQTNTLTAAIEAGDVFATRFKPIITGPTGTFIKLYWRNPTYNTYLPIPTASYEVINPAAGLIAVLSAGPTGFTDVLADYQYLTNSVTEDFFSSVVNSINVGVSGLDDISSQFAFQTRTLPITRNMTDYVNGKIPTLRPPNFERLNIEYYPVIEYYVNSDGELIFSRDFFRYGDMPADLIVEYSTLGIVPRVGVEITRSGSPAATPTIYSVSLRVREGSSSPVRESS